MAFAAFDVLAAVCGRGMKAASPTSAALPTYIFGTERSKDRLQEWFLRRLPEGEKLRAQDSLGDSLLC